jgi:hypothetical protein
MTLWRRSKSSGEKAGLAWGSAYATDDGALILRDVMREVVRGAEAGPRWI